MKPSLEPQPYTSHPKPYALNQVNKELIYQMPYCAKASAEMFFEEGNGHAAFRHGRHDDDILILSD